MSENAARFDQLVEASGSALSAGAMRLGLALCELSARFAEGNHPGALGDRELELHVERAGRERRGREPHPRGNPVRRVLHVLTDAWPTGGHTRLAWNWIRKDSGRQHDVVLLKQTSVVPVDLVRAARSAGGRVVDLTWARRGYTRQAAALVEAARPADVVVLHHHPFDVLPADAFADPAVRPPTILVNHAGRVFATGSAAGDVVGWLRPATRDLLVPRRGVPRSRLAYLPIPLAHPVDPARAARVRRRARARLGIPADAFCLLTVGSELKYRPVDEVSLPGILTEYVATHHDVHVLAVGPRNRGDWVRAGEATAGRIRALGPRSPTGPLLAAADVAIDSYPLSSETSVREAALMGLPVVSFTRLRAIAPASTIDLPGDADAHILRADDGDALSSALSELGGDRDRRFRLGVAFRDAVAEASSGPQWTEHICLLYEQAVTAPPMSAEQLAEPERPFDALDAVVLSSEAGGWKETTMAAAERGLLGERTAVAQSGVRAPTTSRARRAAGRATRGIRRAPKRRRS